jgi:hypothetical protein
VSAAERARAVLATYDTHDPATTNAGGFYRSGEAVEHYSLIDTAAEMAAILHELVDADPQGAVKVGDLDPEPDWEGDFCATDTRCSLHIGHTGAHLSVSLNPLTGRATVMQVWA